MRVRLQNRDLKFFDENCKFKQRTKFQCENQCRPDCKFSYYSIDKQRKSKKDWDRYLYLLHSPMPDLIIKYTRQMTFIAFVCNFGGLLGMWLGLSILTVCESSLDFLFGKQFNFKVLSSKLGNLNHLNFNVTNHNHFMKKSDKHQIHNSFNSFGNL